MDLPVNDQGLIWRSGPRPNVVGRAGVSWVDPVCTAGQGGLAKLGGSGLQAGAAIAQVGCGIKHATSSGFNQVALVTAGGDHPYCGVEGYRKMVGPLAAGLAVVAQTSGWVVAVTGQPELT